MNKKIIQTFTENAKILLRKAIIQAAFNYGIEPNKVIKDSKIIYGRFLSSVEESQRKELIKQINERGFDDVVDEVTYTWFNRFVALRFMEVNGYLPSHTRIFSDEAGNFNPQIIKEALTLDIYGIDRLKVSELVQNNRTEELFKYLVILQCNALSKPMPMMFEKIAHYSELLFPNGLLKNDSILNHLVCDIPEEYWSDQIQIIGWMYEYYVSSKREELRKLNIVSKKHMATVNQVFTPDWIVKYMAENSIGRIWVEANPGTTLKLDMKYYVDEDKQPEEIKSKFEEIRYKNINPEDIKIIEPCCGSGHILVYCFDLLYKMYAERGYSQREIATLILRNNLWGLDIDKRAAQLAYFALMMKARSMDRQFLTREFIQQPNIYEIIDSTRIVRENFEEYMNRHDIPQKYVYIIKDLVDVFKNAKVLGSTIVLPSYDYLKIEDEIKANWQKDIILIDEMNFFEEGFQDLCNILKLADILTKKYDVVITNPPYSAIAKLEEENKQYLSKNYPSSNSKCNFCSIFLENKMVKKYGMIAMITSSLWMIQESFSAVRKNILEKNYIVSLLDIGEGEVNAQVETVAFIIRNCSFNHTGSYFSLKDKDNRRDPSKHVYSEKPLYINQSLFIKSKNNAISIASVLSNFNEDISEFVSDFAVGKDGLHTGDNEKYLRLWHEVEWNQIKIDSKNLEDAKASNKKWFPYCKGGEFRPFYGNNEFVINWYNDGEDVKNNIDPVSKKQRSHGFNGKYSFLEGCTWTYRSHSGLSLRYSQNGFLFDGKGSKLFAKDGANIFSLIGYLNSSIARQYIGFTATTAYEVSSLTKLPYKKSIDSDVEIAENTKRLIELAKFIWDISETSWDFSRHELIGSGLIEQIYERTSFDRISKKNEYKKLKDRNDQLISKHFNQSVITVCDADEDIEMFAISPESGVKSLISYIIGISFGRYSIDCDGLVYAGGKWNPSAYHTVIPDCNNIIPILDDGYYADDALNKIIEFVRGIFGAENLEDNLKYMADSIGGKGTSREIIRNYMMSDFYTDHLKTYKKRPIYWLFDAGRKNSFKALIYMHRYTHDLVAKIRTDYILPLMDKYASRIKYLEEEIPTVSGLMATKFIKELDKIRAQYKEICEYEQKIHHLADKKISIDLDDGVKHNYELFKDVLAPIK